MKKILTATAVAAALAAGNVEAAGQATGQFNVTINLTAACSVSSITDVVFAYTALQGSAQPSNGGGGAFTVKCSNTLPYSLYLQAGTAGPFTSTSGSIGPITDSAVQLQYSLSLSASTGLVADGTNQAYSISGTMPSGQAGKCATSAAVCDNSAATNRTHTLIVSY